MAALDGLRIKSFKKKKKMGFVCLMGNLKGFTRQHPVTALKALKETPCPTAAHFESEAEFTPAD